MATIRESLKSISGYPVPLETLMDISAKRGLSFDDEATLDVLKSESYQLAKADVMVWVSFAPNVQQVGVSYNMLPSDREEMRKQANAIYGDLGDGGFIAESKVKYGYKGSRL
jgi:hypothetical protein